MRNDAILYVRNNLLGWDYVPITGIKQIDIIKQHIEYTCSVGVIRLSFDESPHDILGEDALAIICEEENNIDCLYMLYFHDGSAKYPYKSIYNSIRQLIDFDRINFITIEQDSAETLPTTVGHRNVGECMECILIKIISPRKLTFNQKRIKKYRAVQIVLDHSYLNDDNYLEMQLSEMHNYVDLNDLEIINTFVFSKYKDWMEYVLEYHQNIDLVIFPGFVACTENIDQFYCEEVESTLTELLNEFGIVVSPCITVINSPDEFSVMLDSQGKYEQDCKVACVYRRIHESNEKIPLVYVKTHPGGRDISQVRNELYRYCYKRDIIFSERVCDSSIIGGFETEGFATILLTIHKLREEFIGVRFKFISNDVNLVSDISKLTFLYNHGIDAISIVIDSNNMAYTVINYILSQNEEDKLQVTYNCID
jgi:hypothetical protein